MIDIERIVMLLLANLATEVPSDNTDMCMELLGFDILVDNNFKPWLIEINSPPALHVDGEVDKIVKPQLVKDIIKVVFHSDDVEKNTIAGPSASIFSYHNSPIKGKTNFRSTTQTEKKPGQIPTMAANQTHTHQFYSGYQKMVNRIKSPSNDRSS